MTIQVCRSSYKIQRLVKDLEFIYILWFSVYISMLNRLNLIITSPFNMKIIFCRVLKILTQKFYELLDYYGKHNINMGSDLNIAC